MNKQTCLLLVAIVCLGTLAALYSGTVKETRQGILDQNRVDKIETQEEAYNASYPDFPPPSFDSLFARCTNKSDRTKLLPAWRQAAKHNV